MIYIYIMNLVVGYLLFVSLIERDCFVESHAKLDEQISLW